MPVLLAIDAAGQACSAAAWGDGRVLASRLELLGRGQSERLLPLVQAVMQEAGLDYAELDAIAVTLGPGGFTGVRIGLAAAEGLALAWDLPILGLSSFAVVAGALAAAERQDASLLLLLDAKRAEVYAQAEDGQGRPLLEPCLIAPDRLAQRLALQEGRWLLAGDAVDQAWPALAGRGRLARATAAGHAEAAVLARLAAALPLPERGLRPLPIYLREPDTTAPRRREPG